MKRIASLLLLVVVSILGSVSCTTTEGSKSRWDRSNAVSLNSKVGEMQVRTTAYTHTEADHVYYGRKNAIGTSLKYYSGVRSAAADWSRFPVGTRFQIVGQPQIYEIDDYGSALVGKDTIDLYKPSHRHMNAWGAREVKIKILKWGSYRRSMEILKPRTRYKHIRQMMASLEGKV